jgi:hypothetical protein
MRMKPSPTTCRIRSSNLVLTGAISLSVAIGFGAYLLGSLTEGALLWLISRFTELRVSNRGLATLQSVAAREVEGAYAPSLEARDLAYEFSRRRYGRKLGLRDPGLDSNESSSRDFLEEALLSELLEDLDLAKTRLLGAHKEVFSVSDRLSSEADLRFAVIPPLILLSAVIADRADTWWLLPLLLVPIALLGFQAWSRKRSGGDVVADALSLRLIEAPASEDLAQAVRALEIR